MKTKILTTMFALMITSAVAFAQDKTQPDKKQLSSTKTEMTKDSVYYTCPMHPEVKMAKPGKCPKCGMTLEKKIVKMTSTKMEAMKTYTCPMHPEVKASKQGKCPKCGMDLVEKK